MANLYIARKQLRIGASVVQPGTDVSATVATMRNLHPWLHSGRIVMVQTDVRQSVPYNQRIPLTPASSNWKEKPRSKRYRGALVGWYAAGNEPLPGQTPSITGISPSTTIARGATLIITGRNLRSMTSVTFAGTGLGDTLPATVVDDTTLTVKVNTAAAGTCTSVTASKAGQQSNAFACSLVIT